MVEVAEYMMLPASGYKWALIGHIQRAQVSKACRIYTPLRGSAERMRCMKEGTVLHWRMWGSVLFLLSPLLEPLAWGF